MTRPTISVVIPTRDRLPVLERALASVLTQSVPVDEVVVVDDASSDGTRQYLVELAALDQRVMPVALPRAVGAAAARNIGIERTHGSLIAFQDSDDVWSATFVERLLPAASAAPQVVAFCSHAVRHQDGHEVRVPAVRVDDPRRELLLTNPISTQTVLVDARLLRDGCRFDEELGRFQDWDLWLTLRRRPQVAFTHVDEVLVQLYRLPDSLSEGRRRVRSRSLRRIARKHWRALATRPSALPRLAARIVLPRPGETGGGRRPWR
jgi:glycosyltransferase involved in cell wall biosynthesis